MSIEKDWLEIKENKQIKSKIKSNILVFEMKKIVEAKKKSSKIS